MAKALARRSSAPRVVVVSAPRRAARRAGRAVRSIGRRVGRAARKGAAPMSIVVGGLIVGYADGAGYLDRLPAIQGSRDITLGLLGYYASTHSKNPTIRGAGLAALGSAALAFGRTQSKRGPAGWAAGYAMEPWGAAGDDWSAGDTYY